MELTGYLTSDRIIPELLSRDKEGVLGELAAAVEKADPRLSRESVLAALRERENLGSTGIGDGIAIPHARSSDAADIVLLGDPSLRRRISHAAGSDEMIDILLEGETHR